MTAAHLSATFSKELERPAYNELPNGITRDRLRHEVAVSGAGGVVRNLIFVSRLALNKLTNGSKKAPYPVPPDLPAQELRHLERCANRVLSALGSGERIAA